MGYHCVVCLKQVPDTKNITGEAMKDNGTVNRAALPAVCNPEDMNALEMALTIRDRFGGTVTAITMGLPQACDVLREALCRGADRGLLLTDRRAAGSDTLATSYILSCAVQKLSADLVLCGRQAIDGDTAQVGPQLAEKLGLPLISYVEELLALEGRGITCRRNVGNGWDVVQCDLPVLLTVRDSANTPRPVAARAMMRHKKARSRLEIEAAVKRELAGASDDQRAAEISRRYQSLGERELLIEEWDLDEIDADLDWCGLTGSPTKVHRVNAIVLTGGDYKEFEPTDAGVAAMVAELIEDHTIG